MVEFKNNHAKVERGNSQRLSREAKVFFTMVMAFDQGPEKQLLKLKEVHA